MALPHFGGRWNFTPRPSIVTESAEEHVKYGLEEIKKAFENADISLNGQGKNLIFLSGHPNLFKDEITEDGVTYLVYSSSNKDYEHKYYTLNEKLHRKNQPAYIRILDDKVLEYAYFKNGKLHNEDGPATMHISYKEELLTSYWYKGEFLTKEKFNIVQRKKKLQKINKNRKI